MAAALRSCEDTGPTGSEFSRWESMHTTSGPTEIRLVTNVSMSGTAALTACLIEVAIGALLLGWALVSRRDTQLP